MPGDGTSPATTPDKDEGESLGRVTPDMSDDEIRDAFRKAYFGLADDIANAAFADPRFTAGSLNSFKTILNDVFDEPKSDSFRPRFDRLRSQVVDEIASQLMPQGEGIPPQFVMRQVEAAPTTRNVAQGADPVNLFNGNFSYQTTDFHLNGAGMDFAFIRTYSQLVGYLGPFGYNWDHSYNLWLRVDDSSNTIHRSNGALAEETFTKHEQYDYWVPPNGANGAIQSNGDSFTLRLPDGAKIIYQPHPTLSPSIHVVARIEDRFGNYLAFTYADGLLSRVEVNHPGRSADFRYDSENRIVSIRDFSNRVWSYAYDFDDLGNLGSVTTPATAQYKAGLTVSYEYAGPDNSDPNLQHCLTAIMDAKSVIYLENEYGSAPGVVSYRRVIRQRQGGGDVLFDYADVVENFDVPYRDHERPTHETIVTDRDGTRARYLFNRFGNMVFKEQYARLGGVPQLVSYHYRYNRDGNVIAVLSPLGVITQGLTGRDIYERRFPLSNDYQSETDPNLTMEARLQFDNLLTAVKRGGYHDLNSLDLALGLWSADIFPDILQTDATDVIQKFTYETEFAQVVTVSDPRFTQSADPAFVEDAEYTRRLTKYSYRPGAGFQSFYLSAVELPTPILPDGTLSAPIKTQFTEYDPNGRIVRILAPNSLVTVNTYFAAADGLCQGFFKGAAIDPGGFDVRMGVDRDQLGRTTTLYRPPFFGTNGGRFFSTAEYNELSQLVRHTSTAPFSISIDYAYDRLGNVARMNVGLKDAENAPSGTLVVDNRYDEESHLVSRAMGDDANLKRVKIVFDCVGRPFLSLSPSGRKQKTIYNERGLIAKTIDDYGGIGAETLGYYDADGRLIRMVDPRGNTTTYAYDPFGRAVDVHDAKGNRTIRHYDKVGNLLAECVFENRGSGIFALLFRREFTYDEVGRTIRAGANRFHQVTLVAENQLASAFRDSGPGDLLTIQYFFDISGNPVKQIDQDGRAFASDYDLLGRVTRMADPDGNEVFLKYDKEGNTVRIDRHEVVRDPVTNVVAGARYFAVAFAYDELGRVVERRTPGGAATYRYDSRGNRVEIADALGNRTAKTFDIFSRPFETTRFLHHYQPGETPVPVSIRCTYNLDDQCVTQTDPLGRTTSFRHDSAGRLSATVLPDGSSDRIVYDQSGNIIEYHDRNGLIKRLEWDELNRDTHLAIDASALPATIQLQGATTYNAQYDALGRHTRVSNDFVVNTLTFDSLGCIVQEAAAFSSVAGLDPARQFTVQREYNNTCALTAITYPSGRGIRYSRDVLDRIVKVEQFQKGQSYPGDSAGPDSVTIAKVVYDGMQMKQMSRHNGSVTSYKYDFERRTVEIANGPGSLLSQQFLYDRIGNLRRQTELSGDFQSTRSYQLDSLSRLSGVNVSTSATLLNLSALAPPGAMLPDSLPDLQATVDQMIAAGGAGQATSYNYDLCGNRQNKVVGASSDTYQTNNLDQYIAVNAAALRYNPNGNLVEDSIYLYEYDHRNQLARLKKKADGTEIEFVFDYFGRRSIQTTNGQTRLFLYDDHNLLEEYDGLQLSRSVVSDTRLDSVLLCSSGGREYYLINDLTRSVRYLFDSANKLNFYVYDEFGNLQSSLLAADDNPFRFAGKRLLADTGKYDFVFRAYDPATGMFLQRDPKGFADGTNLYTFARDNPMVFSDRLGLESRKEQGPAGPLVIELGARLAFTHPPGFTFIVPDNFDDPKIVAAKQRINSPTDRGVGIRSRDPATSYVDRRGRIRGSRTDDLRAANQQLRDAFNNSLPPTQRAQRGVRDVDHTVELQMINRRQPGMYSPGADVVRPQDHRIQASRLNSQQGRNLQELIQRQIRDGVPEDTPAGGIARERDANKLWNREGYRTGVRYVGYYNMVGGTWSATTAFGDDIRGGRWGSAVLNGTGATAGMLEMGGLAANSLGAGSSLLAAGRFLGAPAAVISSGVIGVRIGTNLYNNYVDKEAAMDYGERVEELTGSRILGGLAAATAAVDDAFAHIPEAAYDYARETWTVDPDEIDWDKTLKPWKWL